MGYYGQSTYRGDFMRRRQGYHPVLLGRGVYRGDFLDDVGEALGTVGGYIDKGLSYIPGVAKVVGAANTVFRSIAPPMAPSHPALSAPSVGGLPALPSLTGAIQMVKQRGVRGGTTMPNNTPAQRREDRNDGGGRRRMNVCNGKALRRALRRADGFMKFASHFVKVIKPHHHVEMKPIHHHKRKR